MNKQPFYHTTGILFTATKEISTERIQEMLEKEMPKHFPEVVADSIDVEYSEAEPGDPSDLM